METTVAELLAYRQTRYHTRYASELADATLAESRRRFDDLRAARLISKEEFLGVVVDVANEKLAEDYTAAAVDAEAAGVRVVMLSELGDPIPQHLIDEVGKRCAVLLVEKEK